MGLCRSKDCIRDCVNRGDPLLSKEVLWVFVGQKTAKVQAVKIGDLKKILSLGLSSGFKPRIMGSSRKFDRPQLYSSLTNRDSRYLTSFERFKPPLLTISLGLF